MTLLAGVEIVAAAVVVIGDWVIPTLVLLAMAAVSLLARRTGPASLGLVRGRYPLRSMIPRLVGIVALWTLFQIGVVMPVLNHLLGTTQDLSQFENLQSNEAELAVFLVLTWTIAAFGEEFGYRGYLLTRAMEALDDIRWRAVIAIAISAVLFGLAHTEQGTIGVVVTTLDGALFGFLRFRYRSLWAPIVAHGASNTIGLVAFYLVGPIYGLW